MGAKGEIAGAMIDELRWRRDAKQTSVLEQVAWLATLGLALSFVAAAAGRSGLRMLRSRISGS
jgi:hypothetical protein